MLNLDTHILLHAVAGSLTSRELALLRCHPADELIAAGVLSEAAAGSSAFQILVRDPGGNLTAGHAPALEPGATVRVLEM